MQFGLIKEVIDIEDTLCYQIKENPTIMDINGIILILTNKINKFSK